MIKPTGQWAVRWHEDGVEEGLANAVVDCDSAEEFLERVRRPTHR